MNRAKRNTIIYWVATAWLALGMLSTGSVQLLKVKEETEFVLQLGYPEYLLALLGVCKILGVVVLLIPGYPLLKEWAYAGFVFMMSGAVFSHLASGESRSEIYGAVLLLVLTLVSWYFRPLSRKYSTNYKIQVYEQQ